MLPYWRYFRAALSQKGLGLRTDVVFSGTAEEPCHVEIDETRVRQTKLFDDSGERVGTIHWCIFGMVQRGSRKAVVYLMKPRSVPVRKDNYAPGATPPPGVEELLPWLRQHVGDWCVLHTDRARSYPSLLEYILTDRKYVFMDSVNHAEKQWTRFCRHPVLDHPTVSRLRVIAGTQLVEALWSVLKKHALPREVRTNPQELEAYALAYLAMRWQLEDPLIELGSAVHAYIEEFDFDPWPNDPFLQVQGEPEGDDDSDSGDGQDTAQG